MRNSAAPSSSKSKAQDIRRKVIPAFVYYGPFPPENAARRSFAPSVKREREEERPEAFAATSLCKYYGVARRLPRGARFCAPV